ncbi:serine/threonine protein phosphatase PrpC [Erwinia persicina]|jgi:serine/threonine protein phosphatase PrpC|uniref:PP2C family serine/threonine-protein phosphatase n=2 Tax=Erwinia TaxID=551 RepID=A0ABV4EAE7_9GAMM|nr:MULTISPECIES: PP2C family serine/threonine-protein phosphatase [Erwinia]MCP1437218.1 serine/threonine protein phosphatase PrpC [Erwinia persicina]MDN4627222.1 serine/threonine-protein phosphatase [Erwinia sp. PsM31]
MKINHASTSQTGARESNQDETGARVGEHSACFLVCDGVAGTAGGEQAARIARDVLLTHADDRPFTACDSKAWVEDAEEAIRLAQRKNLNFERMSTTLAALFIDRDRQLAWWAHAGDSRVYHFRRGFIHSVTRDHSLAQQLKDAGVDNTGINSNLLYNALGAEGTQPVSYSEVMPLEDGDVFLVCTDGFWCNLQPGEMEQALRMVSSPHEWLALMHKAINRSEKKDNLSAVAVWVGSPQDTTLLQSMADSARFLPSRD